MTTQQNKSQITRSTDHMSNSGYHRSGKPTWWARIGSGDNARFLTIPRTRGDDYLSCEVDVPPGTTVYIGVGKGRDGVREMVETEPLDSVDDDDTDEVASSNSYVI